MKRRGKCRCGAILRFSMTSQGYKMKCPQCGAVVRLRLEEQERLAPRPTKKSPSAVLAAVGVPDEPESPDYDAPRLSARDEELDFSAFSDHESTAPRAMTEMEAYREPKRTASYLPWLVFGLLTALVALSVGAAAMLLG